MSETPHDARLVMGRLALSAIAVILLGLRRGNGLLIGIGGFMLGRAARVVPPES